METVKRKSMGPHFSMCVQPAFIIGTNNEDGTHNFAPITWVSVTCERDHDYLLVISMFGTKRTKKNVLRTGVLSANLVSTDILGFMDYFGTHRADDGPKDAVPYSVKSKMFKEENNEEMFLIGGSGIPLYIDNAIVQRAC